MDHREILSRITGFSTPVFGFSWNPPQPQIAVARRVLTFLEDRRVLFNPCDQEVQDQSVRSVLEIRRFLTTQIGELASDAPLGNHLRAIRAACRKFLDEAATGQRRVISTHGRGSCGSTFFTSLGELRGAIGLHVAAIAVMYGINVEGQLERLLPEADRVDV